MRVESTRRAFLAGGVSAGLVATGGCFGDVLEGGDPTPHSPYEIWALDQGRDTIHLYAPADGDDFESLGTIDVNELEGVPDENAVPHLISFSSDYAYAAVTCTAGARTLVFRTDDRELVGNVETGPKSHNAVFSPDDEYIHVDVIGDGAIARIDADLETERFEEIDRIELLEEDPVRAAGLDSANPICHQFDDRGRSIHSLGPSYEDAGVVIVDHERFAVTAAFDGTELPCNFGTMPHPTDEKFYLTAGRPDRGDGTGVGEFYVLDTESDELVHVGETGGIDAHGFWFTPDGEELWILNRGSHDGVIVDPKTDEVTDEIENYGPKPDIMRASPDGEYMFVTLRGPEPQSAADAATGETPGFNVLDIESRDIVATIEPDPIDDYDADAIADGETPTPDFHGIGVRPLETFDTEIPTSPPY